MKPTARYSSLVIGLTIALSTVAASPAVAYLDTIAAPFGSADIHLRVDTRGRAVSWGIAYNITADTYDFVTVDNSEDRFDTDISAPVTITFGRHDTDSTTITRRQHIDNAADGSDSRWSMILRCVGDSSVITVGRKTPIASYHITLDRSNGVFGLLTAGNMNVLRHTIESTPASSITRAAFDSLENLNDYIEKSADPYERLWTYLDRDTDHRLFSLGGNYTLATVSDGNGDYNIVYISGARVKNKNWQPMMIKGRLKATPFMGHFNLVWLDATGIIAPGETNATIENDMSILRLNFPSHTSQVRFAAIPKP